MALAAVGFAPSAAFADSVYDRKLEQAVMAIVARKVGDIRGPLAREFQPPSAFETMATAPPAMLTATALEQPKPIARKVSVIGLGQKGG